MTFYTVSKLNVVCGPTDQKIALSRGWSYANLLLSTICFAGGTFLVAIYDTESNMIEYIIVICGPLYILAVLFTVIFLHYDCCCCASCCCDCCIGEELVVIHDPSNPEANLVYRDGQVSMVC